MLVSVCVIGPMVMNCDCVDIGMLCLLFHVNRPTDQIAKA